MESELVAAESPPVSSEWSVDMDRLELFRLDADLLRQVANGFQVSVGQTGGRNYSMIRTAAVRRGSRSRMFWVGGKRTACVVLCREDIDLLSAGQALVFQSEGVVLIKGDG